jgi:hypothetical protein
VIPPSTLLMNSFRTLPLAAALVLVGPVLLAVPAAAQNPLGKVKAQTLRTFAGTFQGDGVQLELAWNDKKSGYAGKLTVDGTALNVEATERAGVLNGKFRADGEDYEFTLQARADKFVLSSDGEQHELVRKGGKADNQPTPIPQPGTSGNQGGVGIAFEPKNGVLTVAALAPNSPATKVKVPVGAILRAVDGKHIEGLQLEQVRGLIMGEIGSLVTLTLETDTEVLDFVIQRAALPANGPAPDPRVPGQEGGHQAPGALGNDTEQPAPLGNGALPAWMKSGMRVTYFSGSASIPGVGTSFVEDDNGTWTNPAGQKFRPEAMQSTGGAGYGQYDFVSVSPECIAVNYTSFVFADAQLATVARASNTAYAGDQNSLGDVWINPTKLRAMREEESPGYRVRRLRYPLDGRTYDAITTQTKGQGSYTRYTYDLETGLLLAHSQSSVGKGVLTPNPNGTSQMGEGVTTIVHGHLLSLRELKLPWTGQKAPQWLRQVQQMRYAGTYKNSLAEGVMAPWAYSFAVNFDRKVADCAFATLNMRLEYGGGTQPQDSQSTAVYGPGAIANLWLDPRTIMNLQQGQVLDRDPITKAQVTFAGSDGRTATIVEQGQLQTQSFTYDLQNGQLVATSVRTQQGPATLSIDVQLTR